MTGVTAEAAGRRHILLHEAGDPPPAPSVEAVMTEIPMPVERMRPGAVSTRRLAHYAARLLVLCGIGLTVVTAIAVVSVA